MQITVDESKQECLGDDEKMGSDRNKAARDSHNDAATKAGVIQKSWYIAQTTARGSGTRPTSQHPELGQPHHARLEYNSARWVTAS